MKNSFFKSILVIETAVALAACQPSGVLISTQLRSPDGLLHDFDYYNYYRDQNYQTFKNKIRTFSSKLSASFVNRKYASDKNITISPLSIEMCLGLAVYSASGETRQELLNAFDIDFETFNQYYKAYFNNLNSEAKNYYNELTSKLLLTNSIWLDQNVEFVNKGLDDLRDNYYCYAYQVDFRYKNQTSCSEIERFISDKTNGLIKPKLDLSEETLFVLMNTLYLKDLWNEYGGNLSFTSDTYDFVNGDNSKTKTKLLEGYYNDGRVMSTNDYSSFYTTTDHGYKLFFIKPNEGKNIKDIFNKDNISYVLGNNYLIQDDVKREMYHTKCYFPEFKAESNLDLKQLFIEDFNVNRLFNLDTCFLSNVCKSPAYVKDFVHVAKLEVNRKGIEGAAVTYMATAGAVGPGEYQDVYETFVVDKEFGYILTDSDNNVLFSGVTSNIKA